MGEAQAFLPMDIPTVDICYLSYLPASALQHLDKAGRVVIQKSFLKGSWDSTKTPKNNLNSLLLPKHVEHAKLIHVSTLSLKYLQGPGFPYLLRIIKEFGEL